MPGLPRNRLRLSLTATALTLLTGCGSTASSGHSCGVLIPYSDETQKLAADELDAMKLTNAYPRIRMMMNDYHTTRETIRACRE